MPEYAITYKASQDGDAKQCKRTAYSYQDMLILAMSDFQTQGCEILNIECTSVCIEGYYDWVVESSESSVLAAEVLAFLYRDKNNFIDLEREVNGGNLVALVAEVASEQSLSPQDYIREKEDKENAR